MISSLCCLRPGDSLGQMRLCRAKSGLRCHLKQCLFTLIGSVYTLQSVGELRLAMNAFSPWLGRFDAVLFGGGPPCLIKNTNDMYPAPFCDN